jgi:tRNA nucleotidyltransferase/poly(A) polymerase
MKIKRYISFLESLKDESDMWNVIPNSIKELHKLFKSNGKKLYLVGGSVRDFLTGDKPKDFDLATDAMPDDVIKIIGKRWRTTIQGKAFGVIVVYTEDQPKGMEIATFRKDLSRGRNPEVELGVTIEDDVKRRDLSYNALFYDLDRKEIIDLTGGKKDLQDKITRMVGDPHERFEEDSLRILRSFRFASRYGHPLHKDTEQAIEKRKQLQNIDPETGEMKRISQERIWEEIVKAWSQAKDYNYYLDFFTKFDMWDEVFPGSNINTKLLNSKDFVVVIANLFKNEDIIQLEDKMIHEWRIDGDIASKSTFLVSLLKFDPNKVYEFYKRKQQSGIEDSTILEWIKVNNILDPLLIKFVDYRPTISARELMDKGLKGKELGDKIKELEVKKFKGINESIKEDPLYIFDKEYKLSPINIKDPTLKFKSDIDDIVLELSDDGYIVNTYITKYQLPLNFKNKNGEWVPIKGIDRNKNIIKFNIEIKNLKPNDSDALRNIKYKKIKQETLHGFYFSLISTILRLEEYYTDNIIDPNNPFIGFNWDAQKLINREEYVSLIEDEEYDGDYEVLYISLDIGIIKNQ